MLNKISKYLCVGILLSTSCTDRISEDGAPLPTPTAYTIEATIAPEMQSRTTVDLGGKVSWTAQDTLGVFGENTENAPFFLDTSYDSSYFFHGQMNTVKEKIQFAYFPYHTAVRHHTDQLIFNIPEEITDQFGNPAPMFGKVISQQKIRFYQTGAILQINFLGQVEEGTKISIVSDDQSPLLSGKASLAYTAEEFPIFKIEEGSHQRTYNWSKKNNGADVKLLYVPLQAGFYHQLTVTMRNAKNEVILKRTLSQKEFKRGALINTPYLTASGEKLFYEPVTQELLETTPWDKAYLTADKALLSFKEGMPYSTLTITSLADNSAVHLITDSEGKVRDVFDDLSYLSMNYNKNGDATAVLLNNQQASKFEGIEPCSTDSCTTPAESRKGSNEEAELFKTIREASDYVELFRTKSKDSTLFATHDAGKALARLSEHIKLGTEKANITDLVLAGQTTSDDKLVQLNQLAHENLDKAQAVYAPLLQTDSIYYSYAYNDHGNILFNTAVRCTDAVPQFTKDIGLHTILYVTVIKKPMGVGLAENPTEFLTAPRFAFQTITSNNDFYTSKITSEKGYAYYFRSNIVLATVDPNEEMSESTVQEFMHSLHMNSDITPAIDDFISNITLNSTTFDHGLLIYDLTLTGSFLDQYEIPEWGAWLYSENLYKDWYKEEIISPTTHRYALSQDPETELIFDVEHLEIVPISTLGVYCYIDTKDSEERINTGNILPLCDLTYKTRPSITLYDPVIVKTEKVENTEGNGTATYKTHFKYKMKVEGGVWMRGYDAKNEEEGTVTALSAAEREYSDGEHMMEYVWTYTEAKPETFSLWYEFNTRMNKTLRSKNTLRFIGNPINKIVVEENGQ